MQLVERGIRLFVTIRLILITFQILDLAPLLTPSTAILHCRYLAQILKKGVSYECAKQYAGARS